MLARRFAFQNSFQMVIFGFGMIPNALFISQTIRIQLKAQQLCPFVSDGCPWSWNSTFGDLFANKMLKFKTNERWIHRRHHIIILIFIGFCLHPSGIHVKWLNECPVLVQKQQNWREKIKVDTGRFAYARRDSHCYSSFYARCCDFRFNFWFFRL